MYFKECSKEEATHELNNNLVNFGSVVIKPVVKDWQAMPDSHTHVVTGRGSVLDKLTCTLPKKFYAMGLSGTEEECELIVKKMKAYAKIKNWARCNTECKGKFIGGVRQCDHYGSGGLVIPHENKEINGFLSINFDTKEQAVKALNLFEPEYKLLLGIGG